MQRVCVYIYMTVHIPIPMMNKYHHSLRSHGLQDQMAGLWSGNWCKSPQDISSNGQGVSVHQKRRGALNLWKYSTICMLIIGNTPQYCWLNYSNDSLLILNTPAICMLSVLCIVFIPAMTIAIIVKCLTTRRPISKQICWIHRWATANLQHLVDTGLSEIGYHQIRLPFGDIRYTPLYTIVRHSQKNPTILPMTRDLMVWGPNRMLPVQHMQTQTTVRKFKNIM